MSELSSEQSQLVLRAYRDRVRDAMSDPLVRKALDAFDGRIVDIGRTRPDE